MGVAGMVHDSVLWSELADVPGNSSNQTPMSIDEKHSQMVSKLVKKPQEIINTLAENPHRVDAWHAATGIASEAGEIMDAIKKSVIYNQPLNVSNLIEELGDMEFYMEQLRQVIGVSRETTLAHNIDKLAQRYEGHNYSDEQAALRRDKQ